MDLSRFDFTQTEKQKKIEAELVNTLKKNKRIIEFMEEFNCPVEVIEMNPYRFNQWLNDLERVENLSEEEMKRDPELGGYINLSFDEEMQTLEETYVYLPKVKEIEASRAYLDNYAIFPLNKSLHNATFETINLANESGNYIKIMEDLMKFYESDNQGYFLYGDLGVGKSYLAACVSNTLAKKGIEVVFVSPADLLVSIRNNFSNSYLNERTMNTLKNADLLVLDDLGAEPITAWARDEILLPLLNARLENYRKTLFTSNYRPDMLETVYALDSRGTQDMLRSKRFVDRIFAISKPYEITGINRRHK